MILSRRRMLGGAFGAAILCSAPAWAQDYPVQEAPSPAPTPAPTPVAPDPNILAAPDPQIVETSAPGFAVDWQGGQQTPAVVASLAAQVALIKALDIKPEIAAFFASQPIVVDLSPRSGTRASPTGIVFGRSLQPDDNPVLLHEMLHRYHLLELPNGYGNQQIIDFYDAAKAADVYPAKEYMFKDCQEFFAMCGSVTLYGRAARAPLTRASVAEKLPDVYAWIVAQFGLAVQAGVNSTTSSSDSKRGDGKIIRHLFGPIRST